MGNFSKHVLRLVSAIQGGGRKVSAEHPIQGVPYNYMQSNLALRSLTKRQVSRRLFAPEITINVTSVSYVVRRYSQCPRSPPNSSYTSRYELFSERPKCQGGVAYMKSHIYCVPYVTEIHVKCNEKKFCNENVFIFVKS